MSNLYSEYLKERFDYDTIEEDWGFITYRFQEDRCLLLDMFIKKEARGKESWKVLFNKLIALCLEKNVYSIVTFLDMNISDPTARLKAYLRYGFELQEVMTNMIVLKYEVPHV